MGLSPELKVNPGLYSVFEYEPLKLFKIYFSFILKKNKNKNKKKTQQKTKQTKQNKNKDKIKKKQKQNKTKKKNNALKLKGNGCYHHIQKENYFLLINQHTTDGLKMAMVTE